MCSRVTLEDTHLVVVLSVQYLYSAFGVRYGMPYVDVHPTYTCCVVFVSVVCEFVQPRVE